MHAAEAGRRRLVVFDRIESIFATLCSIGVDPSWPAASPEPAVAGSFLPRLCSIATSVHVEVLACTRVPWWARGNTLHTWLPALVQGRQRRRQRHPPPMSIASSTGRGVATASPSQQQAQRMARLCSWCTALGLAGATGAEISPPRPARAIACTRWICWGRCECGVRVWEDFGRG